MGITANSAIQTLHNSLNNQLSIFERQFVFCQTRFLLIYAHGEAIGISNYKQRSIMSTFVYLLYK